MLEEAVLAGAGEAEATNVGAMPSSIAGSKHSPMKGGRGQAVGLYLPLLLMRRILLA